MFLSRLRLYQFNNYRELDLSLHRKINVFTGENGMGKTNLLDSIYYLCIGKSYFSSGDQHVAMKGYKSFSIHGLFETAKGPDEVSIKVVVGQNKTIELSGKKRKKLSEHIGQFPCVILSPIDIQLMISGSEERRKFVDHTIMQYDTAYRDAIIDYNRLLRHRNALLKTFAEKQYFDPHLLESISVKMYGPADVIYKKRKRYAEEIKPLVSDFYNTLSEAREDLQMTYKSDLTDRPLKEIFEENLQKDKTLTRTCSGVHRDDLLLTINAEKLKNYASQGQLKSSIIALKIAQYVLLRNKTNEKPILLLDDIFDKLDFNRVSRLLEIVTGKEFGQVFITDTGMDRVPAILKSQNLKFADYKIINGTTEQLSYY